MSSPHSPLFYAAGQAASVEPLFHAKPGIHRGYADASERPADVRFLLPPAGVAAAQPANFPLQLLQPLAFIRRESAITATGIPFLLAKPGTKHLRRTANLRGNGSEGRLL